MKVEQLLEQMDKNIKVLNDSVDYMCILQKDAQRIKYGNIQTYKECLNMERGALTALINFRQWIVNKHMVESSYEQLLERSWRKD